MKVIFLDLDGVLNSWRWYKNVALKGGTVSLLPYDQIDPKAIYYLNNIIEQTQAKVVISSSWRINRTLDELKEIFKTHKFIGEIIDKTPILYRTSDGVKPERGDEIQKWLDDNKNLNIEKFIILDDDDDMGDLGSYLFKTTIKSGLKSSHIPQIVALLT